MRMYYLNSEKRAYNYQEMVNSFTTINKFGDKQVIVVAWKDNKTIKITAPFAIEEVIEWVEKPELSDVMTEFFIKAYYSHCTAF
jgi:regulatory protein YycH of two-component signal transduction system YycFG